jgi:hypothetical protein
MNGRERGLEIPDETLKSRGIRNDIRYNFQEAYSSPSF